MNLLKVNGQDFAMQCVCVETLIWTTQSKYTCHLQMIKIWVSNRDTTVYLLYIPLGTKGRTLPLHESCYILS